MSNTSEKVNGPLTWVLAIVMGAWFFFNRNKNEDEGSSSSQQTTVQLQNAEVTPQKADEGNDIIANAPEGTTLQQERYKQKYLGTRQYFKGSVYDVTADDALEVQLDSGNYAKVKFKTANVGSFKEGQIIRFSAAIEKIGTGILFRHVLGDAQLESL